jgi:NADH-quinone oxidoreductase subunit J
MTWMQLIFLVNAAVTLYAAVNMVTARKVVHAALWLILSLFGVAIVFGLLEAGFFAIIQVMVYIGAIAILILFAVMLTQDAVDETYQKSKRWILTGLVAVLGLAGILLAISTWPMFNSVAKPLPGGSIDLAALGEALVSPQGYVLPFEVSSILLLAALVGSIYVGLERKRGQK